MNKRVHLIISGKVQGVWFRASTKEHAQNLHLTGWVRNLESGEVEAVFEGEESAIDEIITWCSSGPPLAEVDDITKKYEEYTHEFTDFKIQY
jgi:acylphosphatase